MIMQNMNKGYFLTFIKQKDFEEHVKNTLLEYSNSLKCVDLSFFNRNVIDPIKMLFDKNIYKKTFEDIIRDEINRQREKTNTNSIGYFHQNIFNYINNCFVPKCVWDVICSIGRKKIYVEMKNKHNTMNSSAAQKIYIQMQNQILKEPKSFCYLVEVIAPKSRNIIWSSSVNGQHVENEHIRRVSIDQFYSEVTGCKNAFFDLCNQLPITIEKLVENESIKTVESDTVLEELKQKNTDLLKALYITAFETYEGFSKLK